MLRMLLAVVVLTGLSGIAAPEPTLLEGTSPQDQAPHKNNPHTECHEDWAYSQRPVCRNRANAVKSVPAPHTTSAPAPTAYGEYPNQTRNPNRRAE